MTPEKLLEYATCLRDGEHQHIEALESSYREATRVMSMRGQSNYLEGMRAMCSIGRNQDLLLTYVEEMPSVAREVGEDVIPDIVTAMMHLSSHTSGSVITLVLSEMPLVARRLGDADVVRGFLKLLHNLAGKAPRGLRPMMENLDELLSKLTLGGLRRWALWGAQAHARDLDGQMAYFGLKTDSSRSILKKERRGTLFVDNQRKLNFYLRALWGRAFFMRPTSGDYENREGLKPYIEDYQIHLPDAFDDFGGIKGIEIYRASAAHGAAHMIYTETPFEVEGLSVAQMECVDLFEDARIEHLAIQKFPGLRKLWLSFFQGSQPEGQHEAVSCMMQLSRMLLGDESNEAPTFIVQQAKAYRTRLLESSQDNQIALDAGLAFYQSLSAHTEIPSLRELQSRPVPYRDDNRYCWAFNEDSAANYDLDLNNFEQRQVRRNVELMEMINNLDNELAGDDAEEIWTLTSEFWLDQENCTINELEGKEPISEPFRYDEWDYHAQLARPDWVTLFERRQGVGDPQVMDDILEKYKPVANRIKHLVDAMQPQGIIRKRGYEEGEELDLNAAVRAMIDIRRGIMPNPRINIRITRQIRDLSIVVLMDLSESTNEKIGTGQADDGEAQTILSLTREATGLLSWAIDAIGDNFAVHGFASDGRHDVQYYRFKNFDQRYDEEAKARMAGMKGGLSTRMGAALRHAGEHLVRQEASKRLVLLITDGEPADIDERDPQYLRHDARRAVEDNAMKGIHTYCLTLDPNADQYVSRIFGENNYSIVDNVERLPERLPNVFAALTG
ncbi:MAG: VWA domain-containing protein [Gammaproteobacteria bacterium]|nr:VWA domain-containing protein [Gammaproteobacteria bacterium]